MVILEGSIESTSMVVQARTSYVGDEILWGHEFVCTTDESKWKSGRYRVDFSVFDDTRVVPETPQVSAKDYYEGKMFRAMSEASLLTAEMQENADQDSEANGSLADRAFERSRDTFVVDLDNGSNAVDFI